MLIQSNRFSELAQALYEALTTFDAFQTPHVVLPDLALKEYLLESWLHLPPLLGVQFCTLEEALHLPGRLELIFWLMEEMKGVKESDLFPLAEKVAAEFLEVMRSKKSTERAWLSEESWKSELYRKMERLPEKKSPPFLLFHPPSLTQGELEFFFEEKAHFFLLAPTPHFWGEAGFKRERMNGDHPLLSYVSPTASRVMNLFIDRDAPIQERFVEPEEGPKRDLFHLDASDELFSCHACPSRLKEVELARALILKEAPHYQHEILLVAPDPSLYAPYIEAVFHDLHVELRGVEIDSSAQALKTLVDVMSKESVDLVLFLELFTAPSFIEKMRFSEGEEFVESLLPLQSGASLIDLILAFLEKRGPSLTKADLYGRGLEILQEMEADAKVMKEKRLSCSEWLLYLRALIDYYLSGNERLSIGLEKIGRAAHGRTLQLPFEIFWRIVQRHFLERSFGRKSSAWKGISLLPLRAGMITPHRLIIALGMDEESFPRLLENPLPQEWRERPASALVDRALILELFLQAERLHCISTTQGGELQPSLLLQELKIGITHHLDTSCLIRGAAVPKSTPRELKGEIVSISDLLMRARFPRAVRSTPHALESFQLERLGYELERAKRRLLLEPLEDVWEDLVKRGRVGRGAFQDLAWERLSLWKEEMEEMDLFTVSFQRGCRRAEKRERGWYLPPLLLDGAVLEGALPPMTPEGALLFHEPHLFATFPLLLILNLLKERYEIGEPAVISYETRRTRSLKTEDSERALLRYLAAGPLEPFVPGTEKAYETEDSEMLQEMLEDEFGKISYRELMKSYRPLYVEIFHV